jgi:Tol biopolymer transport system component
MFNINSYLYRIFILISLLLLIFSGCLPKPQPQTGDFNGKVIDSLTKEPVPGVAITIGGQERQTGLDGRFSIAVLPPAYYQLTMKRDWYFPLTKTEHHIGKQDSLVFSLIPLPLEGKILYSGNGAGNWEIYELNLKERTVTRLTNLPSSETNPVKYSENLILLQSTFLSNDQNNYDLFSLNCNSHIIEKVFASTENDQHPSRKTLGNTTIFQSEGEKIYSYDFSSNSAEKIIERGQNPVVSLDGTQIAYVNTSNQLCVSNIDGTKIRIIDHPGSINNPCWSPDGKMIAVELWLDSGDSRYIYIMNADGTGEPQRVTYGSRVTGDQHKHPCWSSDGSMIFFSGNLIYSSRYDIYGIRINTSWQENTSWVMVSSGSGNKEYPSWSE